MKYQEVIYVISISLQVTGAILLLLFNMSCNRDKVIQKFVEERGSVIGIDDKINYDLKSLKAQFEVAYINKMSFLYIALGYLLGIFSEIIDTKKRYIFICVTVATLILIIVSKKIAEKLTTSHDDSFFTITREDIDKTGVDILTMITQKNTSNN